LNTSGENNSGNEPKLGRIIKEDFKSGGLFKSLRRDFRDLKEYYISEEKHKRLKEMNWVKYIFVFWWWILKSMILKLTPLRRVLLIAGFIFLLMPENMSYERHNVNVRIETGYFGAMLIVFVLMLELKDKLLAHDELEAGRKIQNALLPEENPEFSGWSVMLFTRSANEVSGDLVDFIKIEPNKGGFLIADVAGKGLKAALLTTKLQATVRAFVSDMDSGNLVAKVNDIFYRDSLRNIFASLLYIEIEENSGMLKYVNAGHLPPIYAGSTGVKELPKGDAALGLMKGVSYKENNLELKSGEYFFAYSDGVTEARNESGFFYGSERLYNFLPHLRNKNAKEIGEAIISDVDKFTGDSRANDDLSLLIVKRN